MGNDRWAEETWKYKYTGQWVRERPKRCCKDNFETVSGLKSHNEQS